MADIINVTVTSPVTETIEVSAGTVTPTLVDIDIDEAVGVPSGGAPNKVLLKSTSADFDVEWADVPGVPLGGTTGKALIKSSGDDYDTEWGDVVGIPNGGAVGQILRKDSVADSDASWSDQIIEGDPEDPPAGLGIGQLLWDGLQARNPLPTLSCFLSKSTGQSIATGGALYAVTFDVEQHDEGDLHSTSVNTDRITIPTNGAGIWVFGYTLTYASNAVGYRTTSMQINGNTSHRLGVCTMPMVGGGEYSGSGTAVMRLNAGDYIRVSTGQTSGGALSILANNTATYFTSFYAYRIGS